MTLEMSSDRQGSSVEGETFWEEEEQVHERNIYDESLSVRGVGGGWEVMGNE